MIDNRPVITVVGSFAVGMTLRAPRFPVAGETLIGSDFDMGPGGKGSNQAVGAARLGAESHPAQALDDELLAAVDVLTPNESELRILSGLAPDDPTSTLELAHRLQARGVRQLVVTRGSQGALVVTADGASQHVPAVPVQVVDTT